MTENYTFQFAPTLAVQDCCLIDMQIAESPGTDVDPGDATNVIKLGCAAIANFTLTGGQLVPGAIIPGGVGQFMYTTTDWWQFLLARGVTAGSCVRRWGYNSAAGPSYTFKRYVSGILTFDGTGIGHAHSLIRFDDQNGDICLSLQKSYTRAPLSNESQFLYEFYFKNLGPPDDTNKFCAGPWTLDGYSWDDLGIKMYDPTSSGTIERTPPTWAAGCNWGAPGTNLVTALC